jgi:hypothetical protein
MQVQTRILKVQNRLMPAPSIITCINSISFHTSPSIVLIRLKLCTTAGIDEAENWRERMNIATSEMAVQGEAVQGEERPNQ